MYFRIINAYSCSSCSFSSLVTDEDDWGSLYVTYENTDKMQPFTYNKDDNIYECVGKWWNKPINFLISSFRYNESEDNCILIFDTKLDYPPLVLV